MLIVVVFLSLLFIGIAFAVIPSNAKYVLSGYNTMSEAERNAFDLEPYLAFFRRFHLFLGFSLLLLYLIFRYGFDSYVAEIGVVLYPILAYAFFVWQGRRYNGAFGQASGKRTACGVVTLLLVGAGIGLLLFVGLRDSQLQLEGSRLEMTGLYGQELELSDIRQVEVVKELPKLTFKTNGFALAHHKKGWFRTRDGRTVKLLVNTRLQPYLKISTGKEEIYFSSEGADAEEWYRRLKKE
jgi:hypothetical protein